jgi:hypothetical protein
MKVILSLLLVFICELSLAQVDTVYRIDQKQIQKYLKQSTNQYLVFIQMKANPEKTMTWIWSRDIRFKTKNNKNIVEIEQKWYASDTMRNRNLYSQINATDFAPIYHYTKMTRGVEAYDFHPDKLVGSDSIANNIRKDFNLPLKKPFLNWELDMETFPLLDLKAGKRFAINFYHPGGKGEPKLYEYKVVGDEDIKTIEGASVACWKLRIDYDEKTWAIFYISKKGREMIKMEEDFGTGVRYKVKLSNAVSVR